MDKFIKLLFIIFIFNATGQAQNRKITQVTEYQIKAAFLFNFAKFVDWPDEVFADTTEPIIIGIIGRDPFGINLEQTINGKTVKGRKLVIKRFKRIRDLEFCHILYISTSQKKNMAKIIDKIRDLSVLTIGETRSFAYNGGIISFFNVDNKVRFEINKKAADQAGLRISSRLLKLAVIIEEHQTNEKN
ncbi:MAG: YfiR family protein [bacterium]